MKQILFILTVFLCYTTLNGQISNASFENDSTPDLSNWELRCYGAESDSLTPPSGGNWSIKVWGGHYQGCFPGYAYQKVPTITNGQTFLLTGWALGQEASLYFGKIGSDGFTYLSSSNTASSYWTKLSLMSTFYLNDEDTVLVILHVRSVGGSADPIYGYFDLISLEQVPGINSLEQKLSLKLYPNPFNNQTTLSTDKNFQNATLTIRNTFGVIVKQMEKLNGQTIVLERDNLLTGIYFIQLSENNKIIASEKLIVIN